MVKNFSRRKFLGNITQSSVGLLVLPTLLVSATPLDPTALDAKLVKEFVTIAHKDFDKVKEMLATTPHLLNAAWDWGNGDFETAIGAAGHMGLKDMAHYLIEKGARYDIFVMTLLGKTAQVKAIIEDYPHLIDCIGPHGFTLLHHAEQGGKDSADLLEYFKSKGLKETHRPSFR